jgi:uncharacterized protein
MNVADIQKKKGEIEKYALEQALSLVVLFGSTATGDTHKNSDIDIAVRTNRPLSPRERADIALSFELLLNTGPVDVVDIKSASPLLMRQIADDGILLFEDKENVFTEFCIYAHMLYMETKPLRDARFKQLNESLTMPA